MCGRAFDPADRLSSRHSPRVPQALSYPRPAFPYLCPYKSLHRCTQSPHSHRYIRPDSSPIFILFKMSAESPQKLTKKQRKALAFRAKKGKAPQRPLPLDVPEDDDDDNDDDNTHDNVGQDENTQETGEQDARDKAKKKRKLLHPSDNTSSSSSNVKKKKEKHQASASSADNSESIAKQTDNDDANEGEDNTDKKPNKSSTERNKRYILFVGTYRIIYHDNIHLLHLTKNLFAPGNLKYTTSKDAILQHFSACGTYE